MPVTLSQLLTPKKRAEIYQDLLTELAARGWVRSWHSGSIGRTLFELVAFGLEELHDVTGQIARGGLLDLAEQLDDPTWLDLLGEGFYRLPRKLATFARVGLRLRAAPGVGPLTIGVGQYRASHVSTGQVYEIVTSGNVPLGGTLDVEAVAEQPGAAYNIGGVVASMQLVNPPAGLTVELRDLGGGTAMVSEGADLESNAAYAQRCRLRWSTLAVADPRDKLRAWAFEADSRITSAGVDDGNPRGPGTVNVWLGGGAGPAVGAAVTAANTIIQQRRALPSDIQVAAALASAVSVAGTVYARGRTAPEVAADVAARLGALQARLSVGDTLYRAQIIEEVMAPVGVYNVVLSSPVADTFCAVSEIATMANSLTVTIT